MLTITPALDKSTVSAYCKKCGKVYSAALYAYLAQNGGEVLAAALFEMSGDHVTAVYYEGTDPADYTLFDGILRAGLNYAAEQGVETGTIPEAFRYDHRGSFEKLNYPAQVSFNIVNFFGKYKNCL
jgi:hypothetical protein